MNDEYFNSLNTALNQAISYEQGNLEAKKTVITISPLPNYKGDEIKKIRNTLGLTQRNFAFVFGVSTKTVEAWECGRNIPQGPAQRFLQFLSRGGKELLASYNIICQQ